MKLPNYKNQLDKYIFIILSTFLVFFFYYKNYYNHNVPATGDELNAILVYSTSIKTLFLKNYPNNVTFFHLIGFLKTLILGYELITFRSISFLFLLMHLVVLKRLNFSKSEILIYVFIICYTTFSLQASLYIGYTFTSLLFCIIYYLVKLNNIEKYSKIIFFLLFIQIYNHLVNLYLVIPIIFLLLLTLPRKKFLINFFSFFILPTFIFYFLSIILTGIALMKIQQTDLIYVINFFTNNFFEIIVVGFKGIFFYKAYATANAFEAINFIKSLYLFDKLVLITFIISLVCSILSFKFNRKSYLYLILVLHILTIIIINKNPAPRIFGGFTPLYLIIIFDFIKNSKLKDLINYSYLKYVLLIITFVGILNNNFKERLDNSSYGRDITYSPDKLSKTLLQKNCDLTNYNFSEIEKRNYYFNYLNLCKEKFSLPSFLNFYRSD